MSDSKGLQRKKRRGAPRGNSNALRHGGSSAEHRAFAAAQRARIATARAFAAYLQALAEERRRIEAWLGCNPVEAGLRLAQLAELEAASPGVHPKALRRSMTGANCGGRLLPSPPRDIMS